MLYNRKAKNRKLLHVPLGSTRKLALHRPFGTPFKARAQNDWEYVQFGSESDTYLKEVIPAKQMEIFSNYSENCTKMVMMKTNFVNSITKQIPDSCPTKFFVGGRSFFYLRR